MKKVIISTFIAIVAIGAAYATNSTRIIIPGARFNGSEPCSVDIKDCSNAFNELCTIEIDGDTVPLFDNTTPIPGTCTVPLYEVN